MIRRRTPFALAATTLWAASALAQTPTTAQEEVRGTRIASTDDAIATPARSAESFHRLRDIGLNTVYVEVWKNGHTLFPSTVLNRTIGVDRSPSLLAPAPSGPAQPATAQGRDLLRETLIEAHRNGLTYIACFPAAFAAANADAPNDPWRVKADWLSQDANRRETAPDGLLYLNPLHHEARRFLLDLLLETVNTYDLDGVQLDGGIAWPSLTMGYDDYTKKVYASEHDGKQPPTDHTDEAWTRWRARKVDEFSKQLVQELRAARPGLLISLAPNASPSSYKAHGMDWPAWAAWNKQDAIKLGDFVKATLVTPRYDEFVPRCDQPDGAPFESTWLDQIKRMNERGTVRTKDLLAHIPLARDGAGIDPAWPTLKASIELARRSGAGGYVLSSSREVFQHAKELAEFYNITISGPAKHPKWTAGWRPLAIKLRRDVDRSKHNAWFWTSAIPEPSLVEGTYHIVVKNRDVWSFKGTVSVGATASQAGSGVLLEGEYDAVVLLRDRTAENKTDAFLGKSRECK